MRTEEHIKIGVIISGILGLIISNIESIISILNICILSIFGGFGALLPDSLEPATSWRHRGFYHSQRLLLILILSLVIILLLIPLWPKNPIGYVILGAIVGYISHLIIDASTPVGLPL